MAPLPPVPNVAECRVFMETGTGGASLHQCVNVHHFSWTSGPSVVSDMETMAQNLQSGYAQLFSGTLTGGTHYISDDIRVTGATAVDLTSPSAPQGVFNGVQAGLATQIALAPAAVLFRKPIGRRFRGGHGRTYLPGVSPDNTNDGRTWTVGAQNDLLSAFTAIMNNVKSGFYLSYTTLSGIQLVEVSYYDRALNPVPPYRRAVPLVDTVNVGQISVDAVIRSQRRRVRLSPTPS